MRRNLPRGVPATFFVPQPGSKRVVDVMNEIEADYPFVDLLKREGAGGDDDPGGRA